MGFLIGLLFLLSVLLGIASFVGFILLDVRAFRTRLLWGFLVLFLSPIAAIVFAVKHWEDSRRDFAIYLGSGFASCACWVLALVLGFGAAVGEMTEVVSLADEAAARADTAPRSVPDAATTAAAEAALAERADLVDAVEEPDDPAPVTDRRRERVARNRGTAATWDEEVPAGYTVVSFSDAGKFEGRRVRVLGKDGRVHEGRLGAASTREVTVERLLSGGTLSYALARDAVRSLQVQADYP